MVKSGLKFFKPYKPFSDLRYKFEKKIKEFHKHKNNFCVCDTLISQAQMSYNAIYQYFSKIEVFGLLFLNFDHASKK